MRLNPKSYGKYCVYLFRLFTFGQTNKCIWSHILKKQKISKHLIQKLLYFKMKIFCQ